MQSWVRVGLLHTGAAPTLRGLGFSASTWPLNRGADVPPVQLTRSTWKAGCALLGGSLGAAQMNRVTLTSGSGDRRSQLPLMGLMGDSKLGVPIFDRSKDMGGGVHAQASGSPLHSAQPEQRQPQGNS